MITTEEYIERANKIHKDKYNYSQTQFINWQTKIKVICNIHNNVFELLPRNHLTGNGGCPICRGLSRKTDKLWNTEKFIDRANKIFNNYYNYSKTVYTHSHADVIIICPKHGEFTQRASKHLEGKGCSLCGRARTGDKVKQTCLAKYGVERPSQLKDFNKKRIATNIAKYGENYQQYFTKSSRETILNKYGDYSIITDKAHKNTAYSKRYLFDNIRFDSKWEIYYYFYLKQNNIPFEYHTKQFVYQFNNKSYKYECDFKVYNRYVELKSDYLFNKMQEQNTKENSKYKCMIKNDVLILQTVDIKPFEIYFKKNCKEQIIDTRSKKFN